MILRIDDTGTPRSQTIAKGNGCQDDLTDNRIRVLTWLGHRHGLLGRSKVGTPLLKTPMPIHGINLSARTVPWSCCCPLDPGGQALGRESLDYFGITRNFFPPGIIPCQCRNIIKRDADNRAAKSG